MGCSRSKLSKHPETKPVKLKIEYDISLQYSQALEIDILIVCNKLIICQFELFDKFLVFKQNKNNPFDEKCSGLILFR